MGCIFAAPEFLTGARMGFVAIVMIVRIHNGISWGMGHPWGVASVP
jgi:hypothetical protein